MSKPTTPKNRDELIELKARAISDAVGWGVPYDETTEDNKAMARRAARATLEAEEAAGLAVVPVQSDFAMQCAAIDTDSIKLGDISPLGFRCSPQQMFAKCWTAMLAASPYAKREG